MRGCGSRCGSLGLNTCRVRGHTPQLGGHTRNARRDTPIPPGLFALPMRKHRGGHDIPVATSMTMNRCPEHNTCEIKEAAYLESLHLQTAMLGATCRPHQHEHISRSLPKDSYLMQGNTGVDNIPVVVKVEGYNIDENNCLGHKFEDGKGFDMSDNKLCEKLEYLALDLGEDLRTSNSAMFSLGSCTGLTPGWPFKGGGLSPSSSVHSTPPLSPAASPRALSPVPQGRRRSNTIPSLRPREIQHIHGGTSPRSTLHAPKLSTVTEDPFFTDIEFRPRSRTCPEARPKTRRRNSRSVSPRPGTPPPSPLVLKKPEDPLQKNHRESPFEVVMENSIDDVDKQQETNGISPATTLKVPAAAQLSAYDKIRTIEKDLEHWNNMSKALPPILTKTSNNG